MIAGAIKSEDIIPENLKLAIMGEKNTGKSTLAVSTPHKPVFVFDFDGRQESIAGKPGVFIKQYIDINPLAPSAFNNFIADIGRFEYMKAQKQEIPLTFVIDSMTFCSKAAITQALATSPAGRKEISLGGYKFYIARGYEPYDCELGGISNAILRLFALGDTIVTFHERPEEAPDSTNEEPRFTGRVAVHPPRMRTAILPMFNEFWRIKALGQHKFEVQTSQDYTFMGSTCLKIDDKEDADITKILAKHQARVAK